MSARQYTFGFSSITRIIIVGAIVKFSIHLFTAPGYSFFFDEFYTFALSRHLAFGYVDLPPLVPALVAVSRAVLGDSLLAMHIVPALAGSATLILVCLMAKEFGGKQFAVALTALVFITVPLWLSVNSIFCYDGIDQLALAAFVYTLVRLLKTGNHRLWLLLGLIAGIACITKMTILFMGPGFLAALLLSRRRKDLLTRWPWLGGVICLLIIAPYLLWETANHWPTLEYWNNYGSLRVYQASVQEYATNILIYMNGFLLPLWAAGLYRIFRRLEGIDYRFLGVLFLVTLTLLFVLHASGRMAGGVFMPLLAAGAVFVEEILARFRWRIVGQVVATAYVVVIGLLVIPLTLPLLPWDRFRAYAKTVRFMEPPLMEFVGMASTTSPLIEGRLGWDEVVQAVAGVYNGLPQEERATAGIFAESYAVAGAVDQLGPQYGLPHAVSGSLTYYLWGPGYSWDVMIIVPNASNHMDLFFDQCEMKDTVKYEQGGINDPPSIYVCRKLKRSPDKIWPSMKNYR